MQDTISVSVEAICDNPLASQLLSHLGGLAKKYCRFSMVCKLFCVRVFDLHIVFRQIPVKMHGNVCWHHQSFVGSDYKAWCQMAVFMLHPLYKKLKITQVYVINIYDYFFHLLGFYTTYCAFFKPTKAEECQLICTELVDSVMKNMPEMQYKLKIHLLLHLVECMHMFGPCSTFNAERYLYVLM